MHPFVRALVAAAAAILLALPCPAATPTGADAPPDPDAWPRVLSKDGLEYRVYQPQLDGFDGHRLDFRSAVSVGKKGSEAATFGVIWVAADALVDKAARVVVLEDLRIPRVSFPGVADGGEAYRKALVSLLPARSRAISLDRIEADLAILNAEKTAAALPLKNDPPAIVFSSRPAILVSVDGSPAWRPVDGTSLRRLVNTRPLVLADALGTAYLRIYDGWLEAPSIDGPWRVSAKAPKELQAVLEKVAPTNTADLLAGAPANPDDPKSTPKLSKDPVPSIVVAYAPTELVVTEGEANWVPVDGTQLLYVANTTGNVFRHLGDQQLYVLLGGRWFRGPGTAGPWHYVAGSALPGDFAAIPDTSPKENVKASVPGTRQAQEALVSNSVPQTAKVERKKASLTVVYDGEPQVKAIEGTPLQYAVNTATPVVMVDAKSWYAVDKGAWYVATSPKGPWAVAASVPAVIYTIPPSSALHYVTYVKVYEATPDVVVVGYTPGYTGTVVSADGVVVYGTGYTYVAWVGAVYYPPPPTYGYAVAVRYTLWTGWTVAYGFGWSYGTTTVVAVGCYPAWGAYYYPPYYRPPYPVPYAGAVVTPYGAAAWGPYGWAQTTGNVYSHYGATSQVTRTSSGYNAYTGNAWANQVGQSYNSATGQLSAGQRSAVSNAYTGNYAAGRQGYTTNAYTGATAAGRQTVSGNAYTGDYRADSVAGGYNPQTGRYAAGEKTTVGNTNTGQSVTAGQGTAGNARTGQSVDYRYATGSGGAGVGQVGDTTVGKTQGGDYYASKDGNVYKKESGGSWSQYQPGGTPSQPSSPSGGSWNSAKSSASTSQLESSASARSTGQQKYSGYQSSPAGSWGGGSSSWGSRSGGRSSGGGRRR